MESYCKKSKKQRKFSMKYFNEKVFKQARNNKM